MPEKLIYTPVDHDPFAIGKIEKIGFTNESQKEIYLSSLIGGEDANRAYNESFSLELKGKLDLAVFQQAVNELVRRHEALRSTFSANGEYVFVSEFSPVSITLDDISGSTTAAQQEIIKSTASENASRIYDLLNGPLFHIQLWKLAEASHYFTVNVHHIVGDGWSVGVMLQDLAKFYSAGVNGQPANLEPAPQMLQYARAEQEFAETEAHQDTLDYWLSKFESNVPQLDMPTDFPRPQQRTYKSRRQDFALDKRLTGLIRDLAKQESSSFVTTLLVAFEILLYKITGQEQLILGLPAAGQAITGNERLVGHCVNMLPLKSTPDGSMPFAQYLKKRKTELLDAFEHQRLTFGTLIKQLNVPRDNSRVTLIPVVFNVDIGLDNDVVFEGLTHRLVSNPRAYETFELFVNLSGSGNELVAEWSYNTQLFRPETIRQYHYKFQRMLAQIAANPETLLNELSFFNRTETQRISEKLNATQVQYPKEKSLHELMTATAKVNAAQTAITFKWRKISYAKLHQESNALAHALIAKGIKPGNRVGISVDRSPEMVMLLLAVMKAGAVFLPLDPTYPLARIQTILDDVNAEMLITSEKYKGKYSGNLNRVSQEELFGELDNYPETSPEVDVKGADSLYILHTSGSTGKPKGVEVTHQNVLNLFYWMIDTPGMNAQDKVMAITSISFDIAYTELFLPLLVGAEIILADTETAKDGRLLLQLIEQENVTIMQATPASWRMILASGWRRHFPIKLITGGEQLPLSLAQKLLAVSDELWNIYGPTETTIYSLGKRILPADDMITIGKPVNNTQVYILDDNLRQVPQGVTGEIYLGGDGLARGYVNNPELTADRFIENAYGRQGERLYRTGDLGRLLVEGEIQCLGRSDQQVKVRGFRIEPQEIEHHLGKMPGVTEVVVDGVNTGTDQVKLVAFIVGKQEDTDSRQAEWQLNLKQLVPEYMVPQQFIAVPFMPLTPNGKVDRKQLEVLATQYGRSARAEFVAPHTPGQLLLSEIWKDLLKLDRVSIHDNFFELGGHSLIAVSVMVRIEQETGMRLPITVLFENSTIEKLAQIIETDAEVSWNSLVPIKRTGSKTPVYIIHGSGLNVFMFHNMVNYLDPERPVYGIQAIGLDGTDIEIGSIENIASIYISDIQVNNPDGPYALLGYSLGGMIAIEMARQLKEQGKKVVLLGMIDTYVDNVERFDTKTMKLVKKVLRQFPKAWFIAKSHVKYPREAFLYQFHTFGVRFRKLMGREDKEIAAEQSFQERIYERYERAYTRYKLVPYDDVIHLFKARKRLYYLDDSKYMGWRPFAPAGLEIHVLPGDHKTFILPPNGERFVKILEEALQNAEQK